MKYLIGIVVFVLIAIYWLYEKINAEKKYTEAFSGRKSINNQTFYENYFKSQKTPEYIVYGVKRILEEELNTDLSKLEAEDNFSTNLNFFFTRDSMADVEIIIALEKEFDIKIEVAEAEKTLTVRDIVNLVWAKTEQKS